jgi:hypothetical protein
MEEEEVEVEEKNSMSTKISSILVATKALIPIAIRFARSVNSYCPVFFFLYSSRVLSMAKVLVL